MATYKIWISCGEDSFSRTYFNELGAIKLSQEQIDKYFTFTEDGEIEYDSDLLVEATERDWDDEENDFVTWDTITDGSICWGPDVDDQNIGVCLNDDSYDGDEEKQIWIKPLTTLPYYTVEDIQNGLPAEDESTDGIACIHSEMEERDGVWIMYNSYERGCYDGEFEIPDGQEFDPAKLIVNLVEVAECWTVVTGIEYDGNDIYCNGDTTGKGIDWYVYHQGNLHNFK